MKNNIKREKGKFREVMLARRESLLLREKRRYDQNICESLKKLIMIKNPKVIHSYLPIKREIDVTPLLKWLLEKQIKVVCPKVISNRQMVSMQLLNFRELDIGPFRTIHPAGEEVYEGEIDLFILPGLAFDGKLNRLGYGAGYYDRYLVHHPGSFKAAVLYSFQLTHQIPVEDHDIRMDKLILATIPLTSII